jgi:adenylate cyclase
LRRRHAARALLVAVGIAVAATAVSALIARTELADAVESRSYDARVAATAEAAAASSPIAIVEINESSIRALEPAVGRWPWPRLVHASAVDYLVRSGARVIVYDVLFNEHEGRSSTVINGRTISGDESDRAFVRSVERAGNVVLLAEALYQGLASSAVTNATEAPALPGAEYRPGDGFERRPHVTPPFRELAQGAAAFGHNYLPKDPNSDLARRIPPFLAYGSGAVPSLGTAAVLSYWGVSPDRVRLGNQVLAIADARVPLVQDRYGYRALLRYRRPVTDAEGITATFPTYSFFDVLISEDNALAGKAPVIPPSAFRDKIVFIGTTAAGLYDLYASPFPTGASGVELHATFADNLLHGTFMHRAPGFVDGAVTFAVSLAVAASATLLPVSLAALAAAVVMGASLYALTMQVGSGLWISATMPAAGATLAVIAGIAWRYFVEDREKRQVRRLFGRYVSKAVAEQLMADPSLVRLGGQRREMTVLFSDIRGFTSASERATPEAVVAQLNEYFGAMVDVLFRHGGTLDKFVGDMVMGLFGAPLPDDRHADHAVECALDMIRTLDRLNGNWQQQGRPVLNIGIGINTGEMIAGNIGSNEIMSYTVIGDAVNLGSRLESLNKEYGTRILISETTRAQLTVPVTTRPLGAVTVKGRSQPVQIFEVRDDAVDSVRREEQMEHSR